MTEQSAPRHIWVVNNDVPAEVADEYNAWYVRTHIPQVLDVPGFVAGERLGLAPVQFTAAGTDLRRYLSIFEIEGDPEEAFAALRAARAAGRIDASPVTGTIATTANFVPLAPRATAD